MISAKDSTKLILFHQKISSRSGDMKLFRYPNIQRKSLRYQAF